MLSSLFRLRANDHGPKGSWRQSCSSWIRESCAPLVGGGSYQELPAIHLSEPVGKTTALRQTQLYAMNIPIIREQGSEVLQDARYVGRVDVMKEAVHKGEVIVCTLRSNIAGRVGDEELAMIPAASEVNVSRIDV